MEQLVLILLAFMLVYFVVQLVVEAYTTIDHALMTRKQRRE